ncbi:GNAT family N-acetyltransferase [Dellaglioa sp. L3N]
MTGDTIRIVHYERQYLSEIIALFNQTIQDVNRQYYSQLEINEWKQSHPNLDEWHKRLKQSYTLVAIKESKVVGFGNSEVTGHIDMLYVMSRMIKHHIGTLLLEGLTSYQRNELQLAEQTVDASITAVSFFEKQGFKSQNKQHHYRHEQDLINYHMSRLISPLK